MDALMLIVFWLSFATIAYHHFGFPPLLRILGQRVRRPPTALGATAAPPSVDIIVPAYQEAAHIRMKLENLAALDYPCDCSYCLRRLHGRNRQYRGADNCRPYLRPPENRVVGFPGQSRQSRSSQ
jgi:cellulose synthase/poly-beta-1,6-N-acetylglucosamine synthase-like glycosyltransferase